MVDVLLCGSLFDYPGGNPGCATESESSRAMLSSVWLEETSDEEVIENDGIYFKVTRGSWPSDAALTQSLDV